MDSAREPTRYLALAVILRAVNDMRRHGAKNTTAPPDQEHHDAIVWLGAARASVWFDGAHVSQLEALRANNWMTHAQELLKGRKLDANQREVLEHGVEVFGMLEARDGKGL